MNSPEPISRYHLAEVGALLSEPARAAIVIALLDGSARPATELGQRSGVSPATASAHLHKLCEGRLLTVIPQGRHRYYRLANEDVAHLVESLSLVREPRRTSLNKPAEDAAIVRARTCYRHLAGRLGVRIFARLNDSGGLRITDDAVHLTDAGRELLVAHELIDAQIDAASCVGKPCIDWTERQFHLSGALGARLLQGLVDQGWLRTVRDSRALHISPKGMNALADFGIAVSELG